MTKQQFPTAKVIHVKGFQTRQLKLNTQPLALSASKQFSSTDNILENTALRAKMQLFLNLISPLRIIWSQKIRVKNIRRDENAPRGCEQLERVACRHQQPESAAHQHLPLESAACRHLSLESAACRHQQLERQPVNLDNWKVQPVDIDNWKSVVGKHWSSTSAI